MSGGNYTDQSTLSNEAYQQYLAYKQANGGKEPTDYRHDPTASTQDVLAFQYTQFGKAKYGDNYIDPATGRSAAMGPQTPDLTDQLLQKTRTNFALRLMAGKNQKSMFGQTQMGGSNLGGSTLGGL